MDAWWWVLGAVAVLVLLDRVVALGVLDRRRPRARPTGAGGGSGAGGALGDLIDVFQPSHAHVAQEQERRRADRQDAGDAAPPVDLDAGTARLDPDAR